MRTVTRNSSHHVGACLQAMMAFGTRNRNRLQAGSYLSLRPLLVVLTLIAQLSALNLPAFATELTDLGQGLAYLRVASLDETLKGVIDAVSAREQLILDLRYSTSSDYSVAALRAALASRQAKARLLVLVSPATTPAIADALTASTVKCLVLGVRDSLPTPQVIVDQPAATDRLAYDALGADHPLATLITGKITKDRYDEAVLMKEFTDGAAEAAPATDPAKETPAAPVLIDRVLQRAVHLHRALLALKGKA